MNRNELLHETINRYGVESQIIKSIEEMAELIKALAKGHSFLGEKELQNIIEEMADVKIMIEQLEIIFNPLIIDNKYSISNYEKRKLVRLAKRLKIKYLPESDNSSL